MVVKVGPAMGWRILPLPLSPRPDQHDNGSSGGGVAGTFNSAGRHGWCSVPFLYELNAFACWTEMCIMGSVTVRAVGTGALQAGFYPYLTGLRDSGERKGAYLDGKIRSAPTLRICCCDANHKNVNKT